MFWGIWFTGSAMAEPSFCEYYVDDAGVPYCYEAYVSQANAQFTADGLNERFGAGRYEVRPLPSNVDVPEPIDGETSQAERRDLLVRVAAEVGEDHGSRGVSSGSLDEDILSHFLFVTPWLSEALADVHDATRAAYEAARLSTPFKG